MAGESAAPGLLEVRGLTRRFARRGRFAAGAEPIAALDGADLTLRAGGFHALVGESGSGKSTLARCLAGLERPDAGSIRLRGAEVVHLRGPALRAYRRQVQLIFQDPAAALSPRFAAWEVVAEPISILGRAPRRERRQRALALMEQVGLPAESADRRPLEFSGGQRQRLAIARSLAVEPVLLVLDEALSGLDVSVQAQILNLLRDLQRQRSFTCLLVSHDLSVVAAVAEDVAVMYAGRIVEQGLPAALIEGPRHPHTRALVAATAGQEPWLRRPAGRD